MSIIPFLFSISFYFLFPFSFIYFPFSSYFFSLLFILILSSTSVLIHSPASRGCGCRPTFPHRHPPSHACHLWPHLPKRVSVQLSAPLPPAPYCHPTFAVVVLLCAGAIAVSSCVPPPLLPPPLPPSASTSPPPPPRICRRRSPSLAPSFPYPCSYHRPLPPRCRASVDPTRGHNWQRGMEERGERPFSSPPTPNCSRERIS
jgi:hypothetical protein